MTRFSFVFVFQTQSKKVDRRNLSKLRDYSPMKFRYLSVKHGVNSLKSHKTAHDWLMSIGWDQIRRVWDGNVLMWFIVLQPYRSTRHRASSNSRAAVGALRRPCPRHASPRAEAASDSHPPRSRPHVWPPSTASSKYFIANTYYVTRAILTWIRK